MKQNPANAIKDTMWKCLMDGGQKANITSLKEYVYDLIKMTTQKTAGQRITAKNDIPWEELDMTLMSIVIEATCLVLSGELEKLRPTPKVLNAIKAMDEVIPPPDNKMVDWKHHGIARAWQTIRETLVSHNSVDWEDLNEHQN